jgi:Protease inhibitor Inh
MGAIRVISAAAVFLFGASGGASAQRQQQPAAPAPSADALPVSSDAMRILAGPWDIAVPKNNLKCRVQLNVSGRPQNANVGMPAPCRRSFGTMGTMQFWELTAKGEIRLLGPKGEKLAEFSRADAGVLKSTVGANEFTMEPVTGRYPSPERLAGVDAAVTRLTQPQAETPETPTAVAGRYALARANDADTGCVLFLDRTLPGNVPKSGKASIEKGCADKGLEIFDPAGWLVERDRLFLYARKGHRMGFNIERNGQLVKDPPQGSPLSARKMP